MIKVNSRQFIFIDNENLFELLKRADFNTSYVAVEVNKKLIKKEDFKDFFIEDGDSIEVFTFVGGGQ